MTPFEPWRFLEGVIDPDRGLNGFSDYAMSFCRFDSFVAPSVLINGCSYPKLEQLPALALCSPMWPLSGGIFIPALGLRTYHMEFP